MERTLCVENLPPDSRVQDVEALFSQYGEVLAARLVIRPEAQHAFVTMDGDDAKSALAALNGSDFDGQTIRVEWDNGNPRNGGRSPTVQTDGGAVESEEPKSADAADESDDADDDSQDEEDDDPRSDFMPRGDGDCDEDDED